MSKLSAFFVEMRHRRIWFIGGTYLVAAWVTLQVSTTIEGTLDLPNWVDVLVLAVLAAGFPVALIFGWVQDRRAPDIEVSADATEETLPLDPKGIAVLPFENLSPDPDNAWFAAGIHEEILNQLAKVGELNVIARTSVMQYAGAQKPIPAIAAELHVGTVMEGSVRYAGERVRITAQLIDGTSNIHIWSETFDRDLDDIFAIQTEIALGITVGLKAKLTSAETQAINKAPTDNPEAYRLYLQAEANLSTFDPRSFPDYITRIDSAIALDPDFALAIARKGQGVSFAKDVWNVELVEDPLEEGVRLAEHAIGLDPLLAEGHIAKGTAALHLGRWEDARLAFKRGLELAPNDNSANSALVHLLARMGRVEEAIPALERALATDPLNAQLHSSAANMFRGLGRENDAIREASAAIACDKDNPVFRVFLANMHTLAGRPEQAIPLLETAENLPAADNEGVQMWLAIAFGLAGDADKTRDLVTGIDLKAQSVQSRAALYLATGNPDAALDLLEQEFEKEGRIPAATRTMMSLEPLHSHPRFKALMEKSRRAA